jgi:hypothetical protein
MTFRAGSIRRFLLLAVVLFGCGSGLPENTAAGRPKPGPRPGSSITHTRMCECSACAEAHCCSGAREPESAGQSCESYDFSKTGCGLEVESCQSRCFQRVWRVRLDQDCTEKRPSECC